MMSLSPGNRIGYSDTSFKSIKKESPIMTKKMLLNLNPIIFKT
jgi:hypothetical protein